MQLIPVIDLKRGIVVRGVAGQRSAYRPVESVLGCNATPESVARAFDRHFGSETVYVADLDAIGGAKPDYSAYEAIARHVPNLTIDAGVNDATRMLAFLMTRASEEQPASARLHGSLGKGLINSRSAHAVIGLESLASHDDLDLLVAAIGEDRAVFSLDLKAGVPMTSLPQWQQSPPAEIVEDVVRAGFKRLIVLDLAQVGVGQGTTVCELCLELRQTYPKLHITSGGGVRGKSDLFKLAESGCDAALVASALHNGSLTAEDVKEFA